MNKLIIGILCSFSVTVMTAEIQGMRFWQSPDSTRVVLDLSDSVEHSIFYLDGPSRMVIDLKQSRLKFDSTDLEVTSSFIERVRTSEKNGEVRVVLDLKSKASHKSFSLKPYQDYGHRLVIDLMTQMQQSEKSKAKDNKVKDTHKADSRKVVVAIDAGHGGEDPGAIGPTGLKEKDVALKVAKALNNLIEKESGMKAVLVRKGDYFVDLEKRPVIARQYQPDIFVSFHADGFPDKRAKGASVWVVSPKGASSEMGRWFEEREKSSNLLGGVESLSDKDPLLAQVLLDLSTTYSVSASLDAADYVRKKLAKAVTKMHQNYIQRAAFVVLKMPDIPAMMIEMGFITNPKEEKLLKTSSYQDKIAQSVFLGLREYFQQNPPDGTIFAKKHRSKYRVKGGDTLSQIAVRFNVSITELKSANRLRHDNLKVGQELVIPGY